MYEPKWDGFRCRLLAIQNGQEPYLSFSGTEDLREVENWVGHIGQQLDGSANPTNKGLRDSQSWPRITRVFLLDVIRIDTRRVNRAEPLPELVFCPPAVASLGDTIRAQNAIIEL
jgi:hypothetical protein